MNENVPQEMDPESGLDDIAVPEEEFEAVEESDAVDQNPAGTEFENLKAALAESEKRALVAAADLENFRKRSAKQAQDQIKYASLPMMNELLEAVDNLNRAVDSATENESNASLLEGVRMVSDQILMILKSNHCSPIESIGQPFDPNLHQAVKMEPSEEFAAQTVMMEMRTGYMLHDRVIRPSQVFVSTGPKADSDDTGSGDAT